MSSLLAPLCPSEASISTINFLDESITNTAAPE